MTSTNYAKEKVMPENYIFNKLVETYTDDFWEGFDFITPTSSLKAIAEELHSN